VGFEILTAMTKKITVFSDVAPYSVVNLYQRFVDLLNRLYISTRSHGVTPQKTVIFAFFLQNYFDLDDNLFQAFPFEFRIPCK
jgi:hypothetical protein